MVNVMGFWDQQYSTAGYKYGEQPNAFLASQAHRLPAHAKVLVPADGEGRNGVWLAQQGHQVTALDQSPVGLAKARALAEQRGVPLDTECVDLTTWEPPAGTADAVVLTFVHLPPAMRAVVHAKCVSALKPGGLLLLEAFAPEQLGLSSGGPKQLDMLFTLEMLRSDFVPALHEVLGETASAVLDEGPAHQGPAALTRFIGRRV